MNKITLSGFVKTEPTLSHECYGENFYIFSMETIRRSGIEDTLVCIAPETIIRRIVSGNKIEIEGEIRTRNVEYEGKRKLEIYVFVNSVANYKGCDNNHIELHGFICKEPNYRETPLGRKISDFIIASNRNRNSRTDYIPCIAWGRNALRASEMHVGEELSIIGRLQSREYIKKIDDETSETRIAYEISVSRVEEIDKTEE